MEYAVIARNDSVVIIQGALQVTKTGNQEYIIGRSTNLKAVDYRIDHDDPNIDYLSKQIKGDLHIIAPDLGFGIIQKQEKIKNHNKSRILFTEKLFRAKIKKLKKEIKESNQKGNIIGNYKLDYVLGDNIFYDKYKSFLYKKFDVIEIQISGFPIDYNDLVKYYLQFEELDLRPDSIIPLCVAIEYAMDLRSIKEPVGVFYQEEDFSIVLRYHECHITDLVYSDLGFQGLYNIIAELFYTNPIEAKRIFNECSCLPDIENTTFTLEFPGIDDRDHKINSLSASFYLNEAFKTYLMKVTRSNLFKYPDKRIDTLYLVPAGIQTREDILKAIREILGVHVEEYNIKQQKALDDHNEMILLGVLKYINSGRMLETRLNKDIRQLERSIKKEHRRLAKDNRNRLSESTVAL